MGIINRMRKQNAIYWPPAISDDFGQAGYGGLVELTLVSGVNSRVRWEDKAEEFLDAEGSTQISNAIVYCPLLPGGGDVKVGGCLWLGDRSDLTDEEDPTNNAEAHKIQKFNKLPNLKNTEMLRTAIL